MSSLDGRRFTRDGVTYRFAEDRDGVVTASYGGGAVVRGTLVGRRDGTSLSGAASELLVDESVSSSPMVYRIEALDDGRVRLLAETSALEELPGPRWVRGRVVRGCASPEASAEFYGGRLGLPLDGPHVDLLLVTLPGGGSLELSVGAALPSSDLLVLYLASQEDVRSLVASAGLVPVASKDPYWARYGVTALDPDGHPVVLTSPPGL